MGFPSKTKASPSEFAEAQVSLAWLSQSQGPRESSSSLRLFSSLRSSTRLTSEGRCDSFFCHLTNDELQQKCVKGLCFKCDEKFGPGPVVQKCVCFKCKYTLSKQVIK